MPTNSVSSSSSLTNDFLPPAEFRERCNEYLNRRNGTYAHRCIRYAHVLSKLVECGLTRDIPASLVDVGAGRMEFRRFYEECGYRNVKYLPVDGAIDGTDLNNWVPEPTDFIVAIEILEHLWRAPVLLSRLLKAAKYGFVMTTPNPQTTDVLGMDDTHVSPLWAQDLRHAGLRVEPMSLYGQPFDSLLGWRRNIPGGTNQHA